MIEAHLGVTTCDREENATVAQIKKYKHCCGK
jgi:hypothetical protein